MNDLLDQIAAYCEIAGIAETTFGNLAAKDSRFVAKVRAGRVTLRSMERVRQWMLDHPAEPRAPRAQQEDASAA